MLAFLAVVFGIFLYVRSRSRGFVEETLRDARKRSARHDHVDDEADDDSDDDLEDEDSDDEDDGEPAEPHRQSGNSEPALLLYGPPDEPFEGDIGKMTMEETDAVLAKMDERQLNELPVGASRFGGGPDLPPELPWPVVDGKKLLFLAQIDLAQLPKSVLPGEGWLYVFARYEVDDRPDMVKAFHHRGDRTALVRAPRPGDAEVWHPSYEDAVHSVVPLKAQAQSKKDDDVGQLFGDVALVEGGAGEIAEGQNKTGDDWILLLAIDSIGSMVWGDSGIFNIVIRRGDLLKHDFNNVCGAIGSS